MIKTNEARTKSAGSIKMTGAANAFEKEGMDQFKINDIESDCDDACDDGHAHMEAEDNSSITGYQEKCIDATVSILNTMINNNLIGFKDRDDQIYYAILNLYHQVDKAFKSINLKSPAFNLKASVKKKKLRCLFCGKWVVMLKKHIDKYHGISASDYRAKFNLPEDYPMVPEEYSMMRKMLAQQLGLGITTKVQKIKTARGG